MFIQKITPHTRYKMARRIVNAKQTVSHIKSSSTQHLKAICPKRGFLKALLAANIALIPSQQLNRAGSDLLAEQMNKISHEIGTEAAVIDKIHSMITNVVPETSDVFARNIVSTAKMINCLPEDLTSVLYIESRFKPQAINGSYAGIGQMNKKSLDLSIRYAKQSQQASEGIDTLMTHSLFKYLSKEQQLPYVRNYILAMRDYYLKNTNQLEHSDLYGLFLTPGRLKNEFLASRQDSLTRKFYNSNFPLDINKDGKITKEDLGNYVDSIKTKLMTWI